MSHSPDYNDVIKTVLDPLLSDFLYWFEQAEQLLTSSVLTFLDAETQNALLAEYQAARQEVYAAQVLFHATGAGIEARILVPWHHLVTQYWQLAQRHRRTESGSSSMPSDNR